MALRYMYASGLFQAYLLLRYASGLFQAYLLFLSLFSPFIPKLLKGAIFRPKNIFTRLLLPPQKLAALGGRLVRIVVKPAVDGEALGKIEAEWLLACRFSVG